MTSLFRHRVLHRLSPSVLASSIVTIVLPLTMLVV